MEFVLFNVFSFTFSLFFFSGRLIECSISYVKIILYNVLNVVKIFELLSKVKNPKTPDPTIPPIFREIIQYNITKFPQTTPP